MHPPLRRLRVAVPALLLTGSILLAAGCASDPDRPAGPRAGRRMPPMTPLAAKETFFGGLIAAEVLVGALTGFDPGGDGPGPGGRGSGEHHGGGGFRMRTVGGMHDAGGPGEGPRGEPPGERTANGGPALRRADLMGAPPVMIHVRFTNTGTEAVELIVADFLSPLGNFVVHPDKLPLAAGETAELEPMTSRLAGEIGATEITLTLRRNGATETKTIALTPQSPPAPARQP